MPTEETLRGRWGGRRFNESLCEAARSVGAVRVAAE